MGNDSYLKSSNSTDVFLTCKDAPRQQRFSQETAVGQEKLRAGFIADGDRKNSLHIETIKAFVVKLGEVPLGLP